MTHTQTQGADGAGTSLDDRLRAAGMFTVPEMMGETPLTRWQTHAAMTSLDAFEWWLDAQVRQYLTMKAQYEIGDKPKDDELYEWVLAHSGAFHVIRTNFRAAKAATPAPAATPGVPDSVRALSEAFAETACCASCTTPMDCYQGKPCRLEPVGSGSGVVDHEFKSHPDVFWPAARGEKTFEYRRDDRGGYEVGQTVRLRCYDLTRGYHDTAPLDRRVTNILRGGEFELPMGYCILSLAPLAAQPAGQAGERSPFISGYLDDRYSAGPRPQGVVCDPAGQAGDAGAVTAEAVEAAAATYYDAMMGEAPHTYGWAGKTEAFKAKVRERMALALSAGGLSYDRRTAVTGHGERS